MPSLGQLAAQVRVRRVLADEALLLGALHLQALRRAGVSPEPGEPSHVGAFAQAWSEGAARLPAWVAEASGQHVGLVVCRVAELPRVGPGVPEIVLLAPLESEGVGAEAVALALVREVVSWAREAGHPGVDVAVGVVVPASVLDAARADVTQRRQVALPTTA